MGLSTIWLVVTDGITARICADEEVVTLYPESLTPFIDLNSQEEMGETAGKEGWPWVDGCSGSYRRRFALEFAAFLGRMAADDACRGMVLVAAPRIADDLQDALLPHTRALLIGAIVRDPPGPGSRASAFN